MLINIFDMQARRLPANQPSLFPSHPFLLERRGVGLLFDVEVRTCMVDKLDEGYVVGGGRCMEGMEGNEVWSYGVMERMECTTYECKECMEYGVVSNVRE